MSSSLTKARQSNMELLRILAMFLVLLVHANFHPFTYSDATKLQPVVLQTPLNGFGIIFTEAIAVTCVNLFILISGYFGIRLRPQTILNFIFTILFYALACFLFLGLRDSSLLSIGTLIEVLTNSFNLESMNMWFVGAYLVLLFVSPILNSFIEQASRKKLLFYILLFYLAQTSLDWVLNGFPMYYNGYSWVSFVGLYFLGRYVRLYLSPQLEDPNNRRRNLSYFSAGVMGLLLLTSSAIFSFFYFDLVPMKVLHRILAALVSYTSPHTIGLALLLLLLFTQIRISSKWINGIAASSFSVYLIHISKAGFPFFNGSIQSIHSSISNPLIYAGVLLLFLAGVFLGCVLIDQVRLSAWKWIGIPISTRIESLFVRLYHRL